MEYYTGKSPIYAFSHTRSQPWQLVRTRITFMLARSRFLDGEKYLFGVWLPECGIETLARREFQGFLRLHEGDDRHVHSGSQVHGARIRCHEQMRTL